MEHYSVIFLCFSVSGTVDASCFMPPKPCVVLCNPFNTNIVSFHLFPIYSHSPFLIVSVCLVNVVYLKCPNILVFLINRPPQDDYSATNLQTVSDVLYLNLFDEYIVDVNQVSTSSSLTIVWSVVLYV